jgi:hypothetical protein
MKPIKGRLNARNSGSPEILRGAYSYDVILRHPKTNAEMRRFRTGKDEAYAFADVIASESIVVDVKRVRVKQVSK